MSNKDVLTCSVIDATQIPFMHYGIINSFNFDEKMLPKIPIKRWDPLSFNYGLNEKYGLYSYVYGHYSYISPIRADRPIERVNDIENDPTTNPTTDLAVDKSPVINAKEGLWVRPPVDLFEPQILGIPYCDGNTIVPAHSIILTDGIIEKDPVFTDKATTHHELAGKAITMINKFPAMARVIEPILLPKISDYISNHDVNAKIAQGVCTVTIPRHYCTRVQDVNSIELASLFESMIASIRYVIRSAVSEQNVSSIPISPFFNVGKMVGGSLKRIHSQVYMDLVQDGHGSKIENLLTAFDKMSRSGFCHLCRSAHGNDDRIIIENDQWVVFATGSPVRTFHLRFSPKEHIRHVGLLNRQALISLSEIIRQIFSALDLLNVNPNRNIIWNTRPYGYNTDFHIFGDILPHEFVGGAEMADDMRVVRESPREIAKKVRDALKLI